MNQFRILFAGSAIMFAIIFSSWSFVFDDRRGDGLILLCTAIYSLYLIYLDMLILNMIKRITSILKEKNESFPHLNVYFPKLKMQVYLALFILIALVAACTFIGYTKTFTSYIAKPGSWF